METNVPTLVRMHSNNQNNLIKDVIKYLISENNNLTFDLSFAFKVTVTSDFLYSIFFIFWPFTNIIAAVSWRGRDRPWGLPHTWP